MPSACSFVYPLENMDADLASQLSLKAQNKHSSIPSELAKNSCTRSSAHPAVITFHIK